MIHFAPANKFNPYIIVCGGLHHRTVEFTAVLQSNSVYKGGVHGGMGFSIPLGNSKVKLFAEARYHHMYTKPHATTMIPVTFGFRW